MKNCRGIIFDFDFTLADSSKGVEECVNYALKKLGFKEGSIDKIKETIGLTLEQTLTYLVGEQHTDKSERFKFYFIERADEIMADFTDIFTETPRVLRLLHKKGLKLGIVSTKFRYRIETILSRENLRDLFDVIIGGEDVPKLKPDPFGLISAVKKLNLSFSEVLYVGDSIIDAETASRANIHFIAILTGVTTYKEFDHFQVDSFIEKLSDLPKLILK